MRKVTILILGGFVFLLTACNNATETSTASSASKSNAAGEQNLAAFNVVFNAFKTGDTSKIDSVVASDFVDHTERGDLGRNDLKTTIVEVHKGMPDMKSEKIKELADEDYVFSLIRYSGTSDGEMGMKPGPYDFKTLEVVRFKDGKAAEHWAYMEMTEVMKMMAPPKDTTKKK